MPIVLTLQHRAGTGPAERRTLSGGTLSMGRGPGNDWVLDDPDRHLSKTHCMVSLEAGRWYVTDLSTNGIFVNGAREATRRDARIALTDGDSFRLGDYTISVAEAAGAGLPAASASAVPYDPLADPLGGDSFDDPFGETPAVRKPFAHPIPHAAPTQRFADPFDDIDQDRPRPPTLHDDLFKGAEPSDPWSGPSQPDNVDAPFHAVSVQRQISPVNLDDFDFDALLGDTPLEGAGDPFAHAAASGGPACRGPALGAPAGTPCAARARPCCPGAGRAAAAQRAPARRCRRRLCRVPGRLPGGGSDVPSPHRSRATRKPCARPVRFFARWSKAYARC